MNLSVLYRGPLSSCNYACGYCPFSKRKETDRQLQRDRDALDRFVDWLQSQTQHEWRVLFTPWGEALVRSWYRDAVAALSHLPHLASVAVQTNLSYGLDWIDGCNAESLSFWATFHPTETTAETFVRKVVELWDRSIRVSVGVVGVPEFAEEIVDLRRRLPNEIYMWINAQQPRRRPYTPAETALFQSLDPQFPLSARRQPSFGKPCRTGEVSFTVDGRGDMRRCHFVDEIIGNCYDAGWELALQPRACPNRFCDCYLGKSQLLADALTPFFGSTLLERLPVEPAAL